MSRFSGKLLKNRVFVKEKSADESPLEARWEDRAREKGWRRAAE
jgi:hypothetical protein